MDGNSIWASHLSIHTYKNNNDQYVENNAIFLCIALTSQQVSSVSSAEQNWKQRLKTAEST